MKRIALSLLLTAILVMVACKTSPSSSSEETSGTISVSGTSEKTTSGAASSEKNTEKKEPELLQTQTGNEEGSGVGNSKEETDKSETTKAENSMVESKTETTADESNPSEAKTETDKAAVSTTETGKIEDSEAEKITTETATTEESTAETGKTEESTPEQKSTEESTEEPSVHDTTVETATSSDTTDTADETTETTSVEKITEAAASTHEHTYVNGKCTSCGYIMPNRTAYQYLDTVNGVELYYLGISYETSWNNLNYYQFHFKAVNTTDTAATVFTNSSEHRINGHEGFFTWGGSDLIQGKSAGEFEVPVFCNDLARFGEDTVESILQFRIDIEFSDKEELSSTNTFDFYPYR